MAQYCHASHVVYHEGVAQRAHNLSPVPFGAAKRAKESSYHCSDTASQRTTTVVHGTTWRSEITYSNAPGSSSSQHHSSGSHGIRYPRPDAAQRLASDGDGDRGSDRAQPLATEGGGDGGSGTAQPLASAGSSTRRAGQKQLPMSYFFRA